jgi:hypothetical protein
MHGLPLMARAWHRRAAQQVTAVRRKSAQVAAASQASSWFGGLGRFVMRGREAAGVPDARSSPRARAAPPRPPRWTASDRADVDAAGQNMSPWAR